MDEKLLILNNLENELWRSFYLIKDKITNEYIKTLKLYENRLPINFYIDETIKDSYGLPILELKKDLIKPIIIIPLLSKLEKGEYHTSKSKSDINISKSIRWFYNYLEPFNRYEDQDDITYIINNHRLLTLEIFKFYSNNPKISLTTIESRFVAILRIFYIAYGNNNTSKEYDLYKKISLIMTNLQHHHLKDEMKNKLNEREAKAFVSFNIILGKQEQINNDFNSLKDKTTSEAYKLNQDLLLVSLYSIGPILRDEVKTLEYTFIQEVEGNYIYFKDDDLIMDLLDTKKRHKPIKINLTEQYKELSNLLKESYNLYNRKYLFTEYDNKNTKASIQSLSKRLIKIFKFTNKNIGTNSIRSAYYTYQYDFKKLTTEEKEKIAKEMRTSRGCLDLNYNKNLENVKEHLEKVIIINEEKDIINPYKRQLKLNKAYYDKNKEELRAKHKEHYDKQDKTIMARKKILLYLNKDKDYINRIKKETLLKYDIKQDGNDKYY
jgi:hypothetical protein